MEQFAAVCKSPWCKVTFFYTEQDFIIIKNDNDRFNKLNNSERKEAPKFCKKCQSFDKELSGGVTWTDKEYEGDRFDGMPHQIKYKVTNYKL